MSPIYSTLFGTYGETSLREHECEYDEEELQEELDKLQIGRDTKNQLLELFYTYYNRWSLNAFVLGLHLGLTLNTGANSHRPASARHSPGRGE